MGVKKQEQTTPPHLYHIKGGNINTQVKQYQVLNTYNTQILKPQLHWLICQVTRTYCSFFFNWFIVGLFWLWLVLWFSLLFFPTIFWHSLVSWQKKRGSAKVWALQHKNSRSKAVPSFTSFRKSRDMVLWRFQVLIFRASNKQCHNTELHSLLFTGLLSDLIKKLQHY